MTTEKRLHQLILAVAEGNAVDWALEKASASGAEEHALLQALELVAQLSRLHRVLDAKHEGPGCSPAATRSRRGRAE